VSAVRLVWGGMVGDGAVVMLGNCVSFQVRELMALLDSDIIEDATVFRTVTR